MECAAITDACCALVLVERPRAQEADHFFSPPSGCCRKCAVPENIKVQVHDQVHVQVEVLAQLGVWVVA